MGFQKGHQFGFKKGYTPHNKGKNFTHSKSFKKGHKSWSKGLTKETDERIRIYSLKMIGKIRTEESKLKQSISRKNRFKTDNKFREEHRKKSLYATSKISRISKAELILKQYLENNNIKFIHQYPYKLGIADFYLPDNNLIVECYGTYWHNLPNYIKRDKIKNQWLDDNGYKVMIFCSEDIVDNQMNLNKFFDNIIMKGGIK